MHALFAGAGARANSSNHNTDVAAALAENSNPKNLMGNSNSALLIL